MLEQFVISIQIIIIDIVMAADNAIIIGLIASGFAKQNRKRIIAWGVAAAFVFRVVFAFCATYIVYFDFLKTYTKHTQIIQFNAQSYKNQTAIM